MSPHKLIGTTHLQQAWKHRILTEKIWPPTQDIYISHQNAFKCSPGTYKIWVLTRFIGNTTQHRTNQSVSHYTQQAQTEPVTIDFTTHTGHNPPLTVPKGSQSTPTTNNNQGHHRIIWIGRPHKVQNSTKGGHNRIETSWLPTRVSAKSISVSNSSLNVLCLQQWETLLNTASGHSIQ